MQNTFALCACLVVAGTLPLSAQMPVKVSTTMHNDGSRTETKTDLENHTQEASTLDAGGKLTQRIVYHLNDQGLAESAKVYDGKGRILFLAEYKRDFQGLVAEERNLTAGGEFIRRMVYTYDTNGHMSRIDTFDVNGKLIDQAGKGIAKKPVRRR